METKICNKCGIEKSINEFRKFFNKKYNKFYFYGYCYECERQCKKKYRETHKEYSKKYNKEHKEKIKLQKHNHYLKNKERYSKANKERYNLHKEEILTKAKIYRETHKEKIKEQKRKKWENNKEKYSKMRKEYYEKNKEKIRLQRQKYREKNIEKIRNSKNLNKRVKRKADMLFAFKERIRSLIYVSIKEYNYTKKSKTYEILGCDYKTFYNHLLQTFKNNYGYDWDGVEKVHIDHIIPLATAKTEEEIIKLNHYTNLQLLKAKDNLCKHSKLDWELKKD